MAEWQFERYAALNYALTMHTIYFTIPSHKWIDKSDRGAQMNAALYSRKRDGVRNPSPLLESSLYRGIKSPIVKITIKESEKDNAEAEAAKRAEILIKRKIQATVKAKKEKLKAVRAIEMDTANFVMAQKQQEIHSTNAEKSGSGSGRVGMGPKESSDTDTSVASFWDRAYRVLNTRMMSND